MKTISILSHATGKVRAVIREVPGKSLCVLVLVS
jgi:hypothetical protein